jgi:hypothetical protein
MSRYSEALLAQLRQELASRAPAADARKPWDPTPLLTEQQRERYAGILQARASVVPAGRRSGKTDLAAKLLIAVATSRAEVQALYLTTSIRRAIDLLWLPLVRLNKDQQLGGVPNWSTHTIAFPNGSVVKLTGTENKKQANEQVRGKPRVAITFVDECQDFDSDLLRYLYEDCIKPGFADVGGRVVFGGTGGAPRGYWYELATTMPGIQRFPEWTAHTNPFLEVSAEELIAEACRDQGVDITAPSIQKEWFARFVIDSQTQILPYLAERNGFDRGEWDHARRRWTGLPAGQVSYALAGDFGSIDRFAWVVFAWVPNDARIFIVETDAMKDLGSSGQVTGIATVAERYGDGLVALVGDPGGGGASHMIDLRQQHWVPIEAAAKNNKASACITMRDGLRTGRLMVATAEGQFINELGKPEWDPNAVGSVIRGHFPDRVDAALYGWRKAAALHHPAPPPAPKMSIEQQMMADAMAAQEREAQTMRDLGLA